MLARREAHVAAMPSSSLGEVVGRGRYVGRSVGCRKRRLRARARETNNLSYIH